MDALFRVGLMNALVATLLAIGVYLISRRWRNPVVIHALCLVVLLKFVAPPLLGILIPHDAIVASQRPVDQLNIESEVASQPSYEAPVESQYVDANPVDITSTMLLPIDTHETVALSSTSDPVEPIELPANETLSTESAVAPVAIEPTPSMRETWLTQAMSFAQWTWIIGIVAMIAYITLRFLAVRKVLRASTEPEAWLQQAARDVACQLGIETAFDVRIVDVDISPVVFCPAFRPIILIPRRLADQFNREQIETILAHELAHIRRYDHRVRQFELFVSILFWWYPVVWWVGRQLRRAEEACCDAVVLRVFPHASRLYARVLLQTAEMLRSAPVAVGPMCSALGGPSDLRQRIEHILDARPSAQWSWCGRAILIVAIALLPLSFRAAGDETGPASIEVKTETSAVETDSVVPANPASLDPASTAQTDAAQTKSDDPVIGIANDTPTQKAAVDPTSEHKSGDAATAGGTSLSATLTGRFVYDGTPPEPKKIEPTKDRDYFSRVQIYDESKAIDKDGGIANIFVYIRDNDLAKNPQLHPPTPMFGALRGAGNLARCADCHEFLSVDQPAKITVQNGRFEPHALVLQSSQSFQVKNTEHVSTNFHWSPGRNSAINQVISPNGESTRFDKLRSEPLPAKFNSDFAGWMGGYLLILDNPYGTVSSKDGSFVIKNLPAGDFEFRLWHESTGWLDTPLSPHGRMKVTIKPGANDLGTIKVSPNDLEPKAPPEVGPRAAVRKALPGAVVRSKTEASSGLSGWSDLQSKMRDVARSQSNSRWQTHRRNAPYGDIGFPNGDFGPHWEFLRLVTDPEVQKELALSREQIDYLKPVFKGLMDKDSEWSKGRNNPMFLQLEFDLASRIVTEEQKKRVDQIIIQRLGVPAFFQKDVQKVVGLAPEQIQTMRAAWSDHTQRAQKGWVGNEGQESLFRVWHLALGLLTDDQHSKFDETTGRLISTTPEPVAQQRPANATVAEPSPWSEAVDGVQARLLFGVKRRINSTALIETYLELRNVSDSTRVIEFPGTTDNMKFSVTDSRGKPGPKYNGPYDGSYTDPGMIRLPYDATVRFNIGMRGAGISKDAGALLDLGGGSSWQFPKEVKEKYFLEATIEIKPDEFVHRDKKPHWSGTINIPKTEIPLEALMTGKTAPADYVPPRATAPSPVREM